MKTEYIDNYDGCFSLHFEHFYPFKIGEVFNLDVGTVALNRKIIVVALLHKQDSVTVFYEFVR